MKHKNLGIEVVGEELKMKKELRVKEDSKLKVKEELKMQVGSKIKVGSKVGVKVGSVGSKARVVKGRKTLKQSRNFIPKFVSTIAALSLCVSSAVAHHSDTNWVITGSTENTHTGNSGSSNTDGTTTITNLESGKKIITQDSATGTISSLVIQKETNNDNNPTLEVGNKDNNNKITVPKITIEAGATLNRTIQNPSNTNNRWNILFRGGSTIDNFENNGTIKSNSTADTVYLFTDETTKNGNSKGGQTVVRNFTNNGTIESKDDHAALRLQGAKIETFKNEKGGLISATQNAVAIKIERRNSTDANSYDGSIGTFINEGTIKASGQGIGLTNATITNFTNKGTIKAEGTNNNGGHKENHPVYLKESTIDTFINDTNGIIENASTYGGSLNNGTVHAAIYLEGTHNSKNTIKSFDNRGTIKAKRAGIYIFGSKTTITHLKNSGTIEINGNGNSNGNGNNDNVSAGIMFGHLENNKPEYDTIENTGTIKGGDYGIFIEGGTITHLKNSGTIEGKKDGIAFYNAGGTLHTTIKNLEIEQGIIKGGVNGINISKNNGNNDQTVVGNLTIKENATVEGTNGSGLVLGKDKNNGSSNDKYQLTGKIEVNGTLKGKTAAITNKGQLGSNEGQDVLVIGSNGKIEGVVRNESGGTLKGNITNKGTGTLEIDNKGTVGNKTVIKNDGGGSIKILDWKLENQDNGNPKTVQFEGSGNITLEKLTISEGNTDITKVAEAIQGSQKAQAVAHTQVKTSDGNGAVTITGDLLRGLVANIDGSKTAAAALNRTLITTATARATFLDSVMGNALNTLYFLHNKDKANLSSSTPTNLYANASTLRNDILSTSSNYASNKNNLFFVLPYYSYTKVELDKGVFSKGHTQGLVLGYSFFNPKSDDYYGIYIGYDDFSAHSQYFTLDNKTYFAGLKYYNPLTPSPNKQAYIKINAQAGLIKNNMTQKGDVEYSGTPATYAYALSSDIGVHLKVAKSVFSPELGIGYEGGFTPKYALTNTQNTYARITNTHTTNLYKTRTQFSWFMDWSKYTKTLINIGAEYTLNPQIANPKGTYTNMGNASYGEGSTKIDPLLAFLGANLAIPLDERFYITFNYNTTFNSKLTQHTGYMKLNFMW